MADLGTLFTIADKVFQLLQSPVLKDMRDWESDLEKLNESVSSIKNMLLDVDKNPDLSHGEQAWVKKLREVLYEADDLFDEVITIAKQKELNEAAKFSQKVLDKVNRFFSSKNRILFSSNISQEVNNIRRKLDAIAIDHGRYEFKVDHQATRNRREVTCSFLNETDDDKIIGREDDMKVVLDMVLDPNVEENVGFLVVVGVGGLGKTALARLVYNHDNVKSKFEKNLWVCVSDQDGKQLNVQAILGDIIESSTNKKPDDVSTMQSMHKKLQEQLENKTYLLILDDLWTEDPNEWSKLRRYLTIGGRGSRVVVTTRSERTAEVVLGKGSYYSNKHLLKGLSDDHSWRLFELTAFERELDQAHDPELVKIGKIIVKKCCNVPLAIKVIGTLLYGQTRSWESFAKNRLPEIDTSKDIVSALKLSYNHLEPSVKNCFRYCALFPKDYRMDKHTLISLWMAQGYIDDSEEHFSILLKRCFFQDVERDDLGDVVSFKIHDLMHDLAREVSGDEIVVVNGPINMGKTIRHLFIVGGECTKNSFTKRNIRSCYMGTAIPSNLVKTLVANWGCLRTLRICMQDSESLSETIGKLLHLRYLDLSGNWKLKTLPESITKLYNLQSLILSGCMSLDEWPEDFCKLVNLRLLDIDGSYSPQLGMPLGTDQLTNLCVLNNFNVGFGSSEEMQSKGQLKDLKFLVNLRDCITIRIGENLVIENEIVWEGGYLEHIKNLKVVRIQFIGLSEPINKGIAAKQEAVMAKLQPHRNLKLLELSCYYAAEIPRWGRAEDDWATVLPNLVRIELVFCEGLHCLPLLSNLRHLKWLSLSQLINLEYMENNATSGSTAGSAVLPFFPSLEYLSIVGCYKLKAWRRGVGEGGDSSNSWPYQLPPFPRLSTLNLKLCVELTSLPPCPSLESLSVMDSNKSLRIITGEDTGNSDLKLRVQEIDSVDYLTTLPAGRLTSIKICFDSQVKRLSEIEEVFKGCSSLRSLEIQGCSGLMSVSGGLEHLTALESLTLTSIDRVDDEEDNDNGMPWRSLHHNLRSLHLECVDSMETLPSGIKYLTTLQHLGITGCWELKALPDWISCLSSLQSLEILNCIGIKSLPGAIQNLTSLKTLWD